MTALIIEDELPAARRLKSLLAELEPQLKVLDVVDSVADSVAWLRNFSMPDVVFMDIELADGQSFAIFEQVAIAAPIVFTTAYDQFAIQAFKVNGLDYLLKPIDTEELQRALAKVRQFAGTTHTLDYSRLVGLLQQQTGKQYKERFMVKVGDQLKFVQVAEIAYFFSESGTTALVTNEGKQLIVDYTLDQLVDLLNPTQFFRVNRKLFVGIQSISRIHSWFNSRLKLELNPAAEFETVVARERVGEFKLWLDK